MILFIIIFCWVLSIIGVYSINYIVYNFNFSEVLLGNIFLFIIAGFISLIAYLKTK
jgi:hypothetical protein